MKTFLKLRQVSLRLRQILYSAFKEFQLPPVEQVAETLRRAFVLTFYSKFFIFLLLNFLIQGDFGKLGCLMIEIKNISKNYFK
jgi:hypothetical protein